MSRRFKYYFLSLTLILGLNAFHQAFAELGPTANCQDILEEHRPARGTLDYYLRRVKKEESIRTEKIGRALTPSFSDPRVEVKLAHNWKGALGPKMLQALLPEDCRFVDHQLLNSAGEGIVKDAGSGEFVMVRCFAFWNGKRIGFNLSTSLSGLLGNINRDEKWLAGPEIEAIVDWGHGGGTTGTGNHTSLSILNHLAKYSIAVMAIDQPWHAEGPRAFFKDADDYFAFRLHLLDKFTHPHVPAFGVGHSMGGIFSDMMMRRSNDTHLNLSSRIKGYIPLSTVVDSRPGASFEQKTWAEKAKEAEQKNDSRLLKRVAPGDRALGEKLLKDNKISPVSGMFAQFMQLYHDWSTPTHEGRQFKPATYIWGDADYLYVGNEEVIDSHLLNLKNVSLKVMGPRVSFRGDVELVGHLIFDHYSFRTNTPEAAEILRLYLAKKEIALIDETEVSKTFFEHFVKNYVSRHFWIYEENQKPEGLVTAAYYWSEDFRAFLKDYMQASIPYQAAYRKTLEKTSNPELAERAAEREFFKKTLADEDKPEVYTLIRESIEEALGKKLEAKNRESNTAVLAHILQSYSANLSFRQYVSLAEFVTEKALPEFAELGERGALIRKYIKDFDEIEKIKRNISNRPETQRPPLLGSLRAKELVLAELSQKLGAKSIGEFKAELERISAIQTNTFIPQGPSSNKAKENIERRQKLFDEIQHLKTEKENMRKLFDSLSKERDGIESKISELAQLSRLQPIEDSRHLTDLALRRLVVTDEEMRLATDRFLSESLQNHTLHNVRPDVIPKEVQRVFAAYAEANEAYKVAKRNYSDTLLNSALSGALGEPVAAQARKLGDLRDQIRNLGIRMNKLEGRIWTKDQIRERLKHEYYRTIVPGYIKSERVRLEDVLNSDPRTWETHRTLLEKAWSEWKTTWKERPPAEKVELY